MQTPVLARIAAHMTERMAATLVRKELSKHYSQKSTAIAALLAETAE